MNDPVGRAISGENRNPKKILTRGPQVFEQTQTIEGGAGSEFSHNRQEQTQSVTILTSLPKFFIDLKVFKAVPDSNPQNPIWEPLDLPFQLVAGQYQVKASTSPNENQEMKQWPVRVPFEMEVYLRPSKIVPALTFSNALGTIRPGEEAEKFHHEFLLTVEQNCPSDELGLELFYRENATEKRAAILPITLMGSYNEVDKELWTRVGIDDSLRPPPSMILLHIEAAEQGKLRLSCWNRSSSPNRPGFLKPIEQPKLDLDSLEQNINDPQAIQDILNKISDFFMLRIPQRIPELSKWLSCLLVQYGEQSCVVIVDETAANVPWEMLEVEEGKYLGAQAIIVRWTEAQYGSRLRAILRLQEKEQHKGKLLAYVNPKDHAYAVQECPILAHLAPTIYTSEETLKLRLSHQELHRVGLVYLRYRGSFKYGDEPNELLQPLTNSYGEPVQIRFADVEAPIDQRPVVFVNACHSARVLWDRESNYSYGLVKILLAKFAAGYIGTIGTIEPRYAERIAQYILQGTCDMTEAMTLAERLRRLRREAVNLYKQNSALLENKLALIFAFMYIYYGNPYACLQLMNEPIEGLATGAN